MKFSIKAQLVICAITTCTCLIKMSASAQTEHDGIMMNEGQWCNGATYMHSRWNDYWEGTYKRANANIGTLRTQAIVYMTNYGITNNLNVMGSVPYIWTSATKGTLHGFKGLQDASIFLKWRAIGFQNGARKLSVFAVGGLSTPTSNYNIELLPLSIGIGSTNFTGRLIADYQVGQFFTTAAAAYVRRSNVTLDRTAYYDTDIHYTGEVQMPDVALYNFNAGIRRKFLVLELILANATTLGGFDIRKNDMPFPSNRMNATSLGLHAKYTLPFYRHIELTGEANKVVAGRNVGQATTVAAGAYYLFSLKSNKSAK